tara:strand:- start:424 stop:723 length:300 start_codon:yes stop_codon:yes gene_type:complete
LYKIIGLPNISAFSKVVKRGTVGYKEFTFGESGSKGDREEEIVPVLPSPTVKVAHETATQKSTSAEASGALSLPSIGAARKQIARQRFHQVVRTSRELT